MSSEQKQEKPSNRKSRYQIMICSVKQTIQTHHFNYEPIRWDIKKLGCFCEQKQLIHLLCLHQVCGKYFFGGW